MAEIARNSVLQSSFDPCVKAPPPPPPRNLPSPLLTSLSFDPCVQAHWVGEQYRLPGVAGNDIARTNLPNMRCLYRHYTLNAELALVGTCAAMAASLPSPAISKVEPTV